MENKKKTSVWLIVLGGVLAAYGGYLLNGIWEQGIDINTLWSVLTWLWPAHLEITLMIQLLRGYYLQNSYI